MAYSLSDLLSYCLQVRGSELAVAEGALPAVRVLGRMMVIPGSEPVPAGFVDRHLAALPDAAAQLLREKTGRVEFRGGPWHDRLWRVTLGRQAGGALAFLKPIPLTVPELNSLGTPEALRPLHSHSSGLLVFAGPSCCGKTTTASAFVSHLCSRDNLRVHALQKVTEYPLDAGASLVHSREGDFSVDEEMELAGRSGADVFFLGDLPLASMDALLAACESGALVVATLRAGNISGVLERMLDAAKPGQRERLKILLSLHLRAVVVQHLVPDKENRQLLPVWEILHHNQAFASAMRAGEHFRIPQILRAGITEGMLPLDESLQQLVTLGKIDNREAARIAFEPGRFA